MKLPLKSWFWTKSKYLGSDPVLFKSLIWIRNTLKSLILVRIKNFRIQNMINNEWTLFKFWKKRIKSKKKLKNQCHRAGAGAVWSLIEPHHWVEPEPLSDAAPASTLMFNMKKNVSKSVLRSRSWNTVFWWSLSCNPMWLTASAPT
jgi:hypothetical protein